MSNQFSPRFLMRKIFRANSVFIFSCLMFSCHVSAEGPAVDKVNGKVSVQGGQVTGTSAWIADGVLTVPIAHSFGGQIDAAGGHLLNLDYSGAGAHFFWRDPDQALLGITASTQKIGSTTAKRMGLEGEGYLSNVNLHMRLGHQFGDVREGTYGTLGASWYANENLALSIGGDSAPGISHSGIGIEWQPTLQGMAGLALFAHADRATGGNRIGMFGLRYYFDKPGSLLKRHRTSDPSSLVGFNTSGLSVTPQVKRVQECTISGQTKVNGVCQCQSTYTVANNVCTAPAPAQGYSPPPV